MSSKLTISTGSPAFRSLIIAIFLTFMGAAAAGWAAPEAQGKHLFILTGQSNMQEPLMSSFKKVVTRALGEDKVIVASNAAAGHPMASWYRNWQPQENWRPSGPRIVIPTGGARVYETLITRVKQAVQNQPLASVTLVWMQGENDAKGGWAAVYKKSFEGVLDQLRADLNYQQINFVVGRINDGFSTRHGFVDGDAMRTLLVEIAQSLPKGAWVDTDDLNTGVDPSGCYAIDVGHFPPDSYVVLGQRFARQALKLAAPETVIDEALFDAVQIVNARQIKSHAAIGKQLTGTKPDDKHAGGKSGLNALLDGNYGTEDFTHSAWVAFPPSDVPVELNLDLGGVVEFQTLGLNMLISRNAKANFPLSLLVSTSKDGVTYTDKKKSSPTTTVVFDKRTIKLALDPNYPPQATLIYDQFAKTEARYLKIKVVTDVANGSWLFLDEIMINPLTK